MSVLSHRVSVLGEALSIFLPSAGVGVASGLNIASCCPHPFIWVAKQARRGRFWGFSMREATTPAFVLASCRSVMSPNSCSWLPLGRSAKLFMLCGNTVRNLSCLRWSMFCRAKVFRVTASRTDLIVSSTSTDWFPFSAFAKSSATFIILYDDFTNMVWTF